jgi:hypothetical protein
LAPGESGMEERDVACLCYCCNGIVGFSAPPVPPSAPPPFLLVLRILTSIATATHLLFVRSQRRVHSYPSALSSSSLNRTRQISDVSFLARSQGCTAWAIVPPASSVSSSCPLGPTFRDRGAADARSHPRLQPPPRVANPPSPPFAIQPGWAVVHGASTSCKGGGGMLLSAPLAARQNAGNMLMQAHAGTGKTQFWQMLAKMCCQSRCRYVRLARLISCAQARPVLGFASRARL